MIMYRYLNPKLKPNFGSRDPGIWDQVSGAQSSGLVAEPSAHARVRWG